MSDACLQVQSAVNYRKRTGLSGRQTEWSLSQWQNSHMEEKSEREGGREGAMRAQMEVTLRSGVLAWNTHVMLKRWHWTCTLSQQWNLAGDIHAVQLHGRSFKHISHLLQEGNYM